LTLLRGPLFVFVADPVAAVETTRPTFGLELVESLLASERSGVVLVSHLPLLRFLPAGSTITPDDFAALGYPTILLPTRMHDLARTLKALA
jgi:hypothetical protein